MLILSQDSDALYDFEKFSCIYVHEETNTIYIMTYAGGVAYPLGTYKTHERSVEIVQEIFTMMECTSKYNMPYC